MQGKVVKKCFLCSGSYICVLEVGGKVFEEYFCAWGYKVECWCRHLSAGSCGLSTTVEPCQCYAKHQHIIATHSARKNLCKLVCARLNRLEYRVEPGYSLTTTSCLCSTQYFVQANNWCAISGTLAPKLLLCFLSRHTMRKWARREVQGANKEKEKD